VEQEGNRKAAAPALAPALLALDSRRADVAGHKDRKADMADVDLPARGSRKADAAHKAAAPVAGLVALPAAHRVVRSQSHAPFLALLGEPVT
jgi:hypothetical protein